MSETNSNIEQTPLPLISSRTETEHLLSTLFPQFSKNKKNRNRLLTISFLILTILFFRCRMILFYLIFMILGIRSLFMSYPKEQSTMILYAYTVVFILLAIYSKNRGVIFINGLVWVLLTVYLWKKQNRQNPSQRLSRHRVLLVLTFVFGVVFLLFSIIVHKQAVCPRIPSSSGSKQIKNIKKPKSSLSIIKIKKDNSSSSNISKK